MSDPSSGTAGSSHFWGFDNVSFSELPVIFLGYLDVKKYAPVAFNTKGIRWPFDSSYNDGAISDSGNLRENLCNDDVNCSTVLS